MLQDKQHNLSVMFTMLNMPFPPPAQAMLVADMKRYDALYGQSGVRNVFSEDTDTRFETESDMMDLCDLNEIL